MNGGGALSVGRRRRWLVAVVIGSAVVGPVPTAPMRVAEANVVDLPRIVNPIPAAWTPGMVDGRVFAVAQVGGQMVVGGTFTTVERAGVQFTRTGIVAFDATTGVVSTTFDPQLNGTVEAVLPGPIAGTVFVGGSFTSVDGSQPARLALLRVSDGALVAGFETPAIPSGTVNDIERVGNRLYVAGTFRQVGGQTHEGLVSLNASTGASDGFVGLSFTGHHNTSGSGAQGAEGVSKLAIDPQGTTMVAIGNFTDVSGNSRNQVAMLDLSGASASVRSSWRTTRYSPLCEASLYDSYIRDVDFSPDGSYFAIVAVGDPFPGTLCDTVARWETASTGSDVQPTWVDDSGGDTLSAVAITTGAIYVGGHQRWLNNAGGSDFASAGAVPRPGLGAVDPISGVPLEWNPGRNPRGIGVTALYVTTEGLWVGSDTDWIGNHLYERPKLAYFPVAGGETTPAGLAPGLPGSVYVATSQLSRRWADSATFSDVTVVADGTMSWADVTGAVQIDGQLYYTTSDGMLYRRTFDGSTFGAQHAIDPYNDPVWANVQTGSGQTYRGVRPTWYGQLASITGLMYRSGKLYYTLAGSSALYYRLFSPDSGIVSPEQFQVPGVSLLGTQGMFLAGDSLYTVAAATGTLSVRPWNDGAPSSGQMATSGPGIDGIDWRGHALFVGPPVAGPTTDPPGPDPAPAPSIDPPAFLAAADSNGLRPAVRLAVP